MDFTLERFPLYKFKKILDSGISPIIGIDGFCGSGKSTFAKKLSKLLIKSGFENKIVGFDLFIKEKTFRSKFATVYDYDIYRAENELLSPLKNGELAIYSIYNWIKDNMDEYDIIYPDTILIFEGVNCCNEKLKKYIDFSIFLKCDKQIRFDRALSRGDFTKEEFEVWSKSEEEIFEKRDIENYYDLVYNSQKL